MKKKPELRQLRQLRITEAIFLKKNLNYVNYVITPITQLQKCQNHPLVLPYLSQLALDGQENMHLCWYRFPQNEYDVIKTINVDNLFFLKAINCGVKPSCVFALFTLVASIACQCLLKIPNF